MIESISKQAAGAVLMIRPAFFGYNHETAPTNPLQQPSDLEEHEIHYKTLEEFDRMVDLLRSHDVEVHVFDDTPQPARPDAIFPNNWISFHEGGTVVLYPMLAVSRRAERRKDIIESLSTIYPINEVVDYSAHEEHGLFLEGTGSLVFDYANRLAYACRSPRTHEKLVFEVCHKLGYKPVVFNALDENGIPVYHTNVILAIAENLAMLCLDAVHDGNDRELLLDALRDTRHRVVSISYEQMKAFAGNMMEIKTRQGQSLMVMSQTAYGSLLPGQLNAITQLTDILVIPVPTIERYGGGSVRCMMAGIFS